HIVVDPEELLRTRASPSAGSAPRRGRVRLRRLAGGRAAGVHCRFTVGGRSERRPRKRRRTPACGDRRMRVGITMPVAGDPLHELPPLVRRIEALGYESVWSAESTELDGFTPLAVAAQHSEGLRLVTGVVNVFTRGPAVLAQTAAALADLSDGRFVLGLGVSSDVIVERWNGIPFERPLGRMRSTVDYVRTVLSGERADGGFRLGAPPQQP